MGISHSEAYAAAGVDIEAGYQGVKMMNRYVQRTLTADVISDLGGFGGLFSLDLHGLEKPVLELPLNKYTRDFPYLQRLFSSPGLWGRKWLSLCSPWRRLQPHRPQHRLPSGNSRTELRLRA